MPSFFWRWAEAEMQKCRHTNGSVEAFCEPLIRKRLVLIEIKIAQLRLYHALECKERQRENAGGDEGDGCILKGFGHPGQKYALPYARE